MYDNFELDTNERLSFPLDHFIHEMKDSLLSPDTFLADRINMLQQSYHQEEDDPSISIDQKLEDIDTK